MAETFGLKKIRNRRGDGSATQGSPLWVSSWKKGNPKMRRASATTSHPESAAATERSRIAMLLAGDSGGDATGSYNGVPTRLIAFSRQASTADVLQRESYVVATLRRGVREAAHQAQLVAGLMAQRRPVCRPTLWVQTIGRLCGLALLWEAANSIDM